MPWKEKFAFLNAKRKLMTPFLHPDSALNYEMMFSHVVSRIETAVKPIPAEALLQMDMSLERTMAEEILDEDERAIREELKKKFGFSSFDKEPRKVLQRIKRVGRIDNDEEFFLVERYLSGDFLGGFMSDVDRMQFSDIARGYYERGR